MTERRDIINVKTKVPSWAGMNPKDVSSIKISKKRTLSPENGRSSFIKIGKKVKARKKSN